MCACKKILTFLFLHLFVVTYLNAEEEETYLETISDQIQIITKDLKTLEKAVYQKSDISSGVNLNNIKSDGLNEDILTKHLLKLNEIVHLIVEEWVNLKIIRSNNLI